MRQRRGNQLDDVPIGVDDRMIEIHHAPVTRPQSIAAQQTQG